MQGWLWWAHTLTQQTIADHDFANTRSVNDGIFPILGSV
jgi:hypothetical protein